MTIASPAQQGVWLTEQTLDCRTLYHMPIVVDLTGPVDEEALLGACRAVARAHPALATAFRSGSDGLSVEPGAEPTVSRAEVADGDLEAFTARFFEEPFDLGTGPLARFHVIRVEAQRYRVAFVAHHAVFDGMSKDVLLHDLAAHYRGLSLSPRATEVEPDDEAVPTGYGNWEPQHPALPGAPRPSVEPAPGAYTRVVLDVALRQRIAHAAADWGRTRFELYAAALAVLLRRYGTARPQFSIELSTRPRSADPLIGLYVNELPVTFDPDPAQPFTSAAEHAAARLREVYRLRRTPFARLAGKLPPRSAIAAVSLSYRAAGAEPDFGDVRARVDWAVFCGTARNTLNVQIVERDEQTELILQYPAGQRVDAVAGHYLALLDGGVSTRTPVGDLPILADAERAALLADAVAAPLAGTPARTLPEAVDHWAQITPDAIALTAGSAALTYRQLSESSDLVARRLRALGVRPGDLVAVTTPRTLELPQVLLGILKAGAAYVPVDPEYPAERVAFVLQDCGAVLVVTGDEPGTPSSLSATLVPARALLLPATTSAPDDALPSPSLDATAYVIYTSGSTGRPKGVRVGHRPLIGLLEAMAGLLDSGPDAVWLAATSLSFDIAAVELFVPLVTGGRCVLAPDGAGKDGPGLCRLLSTGKVTHAQATPAGWRLLLESGLDAPHLIAVTGGEALTPELGRDLSARVKQLTNVYGPTEATIWATVAPVEATGEAEPIGRPLPGYSAYVLDERLGLLPDGVAGELHLGGGLAEGYLRRPELTADRFVPDPFGAPGARLYRTGDLVRRRADGSLLFLGRTDHQVKVSGYRIEPGEIEAALATHPAVTQAIVSATEQAAGPARLTAHVLRADPGFDDVAQLRRHVAQRLPAYMVPVAVAFLDAWPLTPNGKVDRGQLPAAVVARDAAATPQPEPAPDPVLAGVLEIWREVLDFDDIGPDEDLFDLGGHSLTVIQIGARIRERFGVDIPVDVFFDEPTAGEIARRVTEAAA